MFHYVARHVSNPCQVMVSLIEDDLLLTSTKTMTDKDDTVHQSGDNIV